MSETDIAAADESAAAESDAAVAGVEAEAADVSPAEAAEVDDLLADVEVEALDEEDDFGDDVPGDPVILAGNALAAALQSGNSGQSDEALAAWEDATS